MSYRAMKPWHHTAFHVIALLAVVFAGYGAAGATSVRAQQIGDQASAAVTLSTTEGKVDFAATDSVIVHVTISNPTGQPLRMLKWFTPADGVQGELFTITREGEPVQYLGPLYKRGAPRPQDYLTLGVGQTLESDVDLGALYDLTTTGAYEISYKASSPELYGPASHERQREYKQPPEVTSAALQLQVEGRPLPPELQPPMYSVTGSYAFTNCTAGMQTDLINARKAASSYANEAVSYFGGPLKHDRYVKWFGVYDAFRWLAVWLHFIAIRDAIDTNANPMSFDCTDTSGAYYAWVNIGSPYVIHLGSLFWSAPTTGTDSKAGTLIHEVSHFTVVASTDDYVYGQAGCIALAISNPANAIDNADSHEYFAENNPPTYEGFVAFNLMSDGGFEAGIPNPYWDESSTNFGTPLCDAGCGSGGGTAYPLSGSIWAWFGGISGAEETGSLVQYRDIPYGAAIVQFYFFIGAVAPGADATDYLQLQIDDTVVWSANALQSGSYTNYTQITVNISPYANGAVHKIEFYAHTANRASATNFNVDVVSLKVSTDTHVFADFNASGTTDISVLRPSDHKWYINGLAPVSWHVAGDIPVPGDYNGDGSADIAVYRPSDGKWYVRGLFTVLWGIPGDIPVQADYDGNGTTDVAVFRPSDGKWYVKDVINVAWGTSGDIPVPADYNGDGTTEIAVVRPSDHKWYIRNIGTYPWHVAGDIPVPGDYDGDGVTDVAVYRPSDGKWYVRNGATTLWGIAGDIPVPGDYNLDGVADMTVFRPSDGKWYVRNLFNMAWGTSGDWPLPVRDTNGDADPYN